MSEGAFIFTFISGFVVALILLIGTPIYIGTYYTQKSSCSSWARETGRPTKFVVLVQPLGLPIEWDCFTPQGDGLWIPRDRVRDIDQ